MPDTPVVGVPEITHKLVEKVEAVEKEFRVHEEHDDGRFNQLTNSLSGITRTIDKIEIAAEKAATGTAADRKWLIGLAIMLATAIGGSSLATKDRVTSLENNQADTDKSIERIEHSLDKIGDRLGVPGPTP